MADAHSKTCSRCGEIKQLSDFYKFAKKGVASACKVCYKTINKLQREKNIEKIKAYNRARGSGWARSGREKWALSEVEIHSKYLMRTYGIDIARFQKMLDDQLGGCAICGGSFSRNNHNERLCVDHNHETGKVRGLLCFKCNVGIGRFGEKVENLERAIAYLRKTEEPA